MLIDLFEVGVNGSVSTIKVVINNCFPIQLIGDYYVYYLLMFILFFRNNI